MKKITWNNPNKMHFESLHKTFNSQTNVISTGNCVVNTQYSSYIRGYKETECNGLVYPEGHLQNYDLEIFSLRSDIRNYIREKLSGRESGILYWFFYHSKGKRVTIGYILTTAKHFLIKKWYTLYSEKAASALDECCKYVCIEVQKEEV